VVHKLLEALADVEQLKSHQKSKKQSQQDPSVNLMRMNQGKPDPAVSFVRMYRYKPPYVNNHADAVMRTLG
jgi:hypothetical protein